MESLTPKEYQIAKLRAKGFSIGYIVDKMGVVEQSVKNHLRNVFRKLKIDTRRNPKWMRVGELAVAMVKYDARRDDTDYGPASEPEPIVFMSEEMKC